MSWRTVLISKGGKLSLQRNQLFIAQDQGEYCVPIEDIAVIVVESREIVITAPLLSALAQNGVTLLTCDEQFLPCGQWLPYGQYHRQLKILKLQLEMSQPQKKQYWQRIVQQKIRNQAFVLSEIGRLVSAQRLLKMAEKVKSGDVQNHEAQAAVLYFQATFGKTFRRADENAINAHLNYAYTILRSAVARALVLYGWLPAFGIFHRNELNPFNLADDFIEPFRPLVDLLVWDLIQQDKLSASLSPFSKQRLIRVLHHQIQCNDQAFSVLAAIDRTVSSFQTSVMSKDLKLLKLPTMLPLKEHQYE